MLRIKLQRVLEVHREYSTPTSLQDNLGDGYLIQNNPMFANIRRAASELGFRFTSKRFGHYQAHSLSHLPLILKKRTIPYVDNVGALEWLEALAPGSLTWSAAVAPTRSLLVHESSHAIAHTHLTRVWPFPASSAALTGYRQRAMKAMMEESFANTIDYFIPCGTRDVCHRIFLTQCGFYDKRFPEALVPLKREIGTTAAFKLIWLTYMHANFLFRELREDKLERCLELALDGELGTIPRRAGARLRSLAQTACQTAYLLNQPEFRLVTGRLYFKTQGIPTPLLRLLDFDFMSRLEQQATLRDWLDVTCKIATQGVVPDTLPSRHRAELHLVQSRE
jgi:hypothetical protein